MPNLSLTSITDVESFFLRELPTFTKMTTQLTNKINTAITNQESIESFLNAGNYVSQITIDTTGGGTTALRISQDSSTNMEWYVSASAYWSVELTAAGRFYSFNHDTSRYGFYFIDNQMAINHDSPTSFLHVVSPGATAIGKFENTSAGSVELSLKNTIREWNLITGSAGTSGAFHLTDSTAAVVVAQAIGSSIPTGTQTGRFGVGDRASGIPDFPFEVYGKWNTDDTVERVMAVYRDTDGTPVDGIGSEIFFATKHTTGSLRTTGALRSGWKFQASPRRGFIDLQCIYDGTLYHGIHIWGTTDAPNKVQVNIGTDQTSVSGKSLFVEGATQINANDSGVFWPIQLNANETQGILLQNDSHRERGIEFETKANLGGANAGSYGHISLHGGDANNGFGCVTIGTTTTTNGQAITVANGAYLTTTGIWTDASSISYKEDVKPLTEELASEIFNGMNPMNFKYKTADDDERNAGFIAENCHDLITSKSKDGMGSQGVTAVLTKIVKMQEARIKKLEEALK